MKADVKKEFDRLEAIVTTQGEIINNLTQRIKVQDNELDEVFDLISEIKEAGSASKLDYKVFDNA